MQKTRGNDVESSDQAFWDHETYTLASETLHRDNITIKPQQKRLKIKTDLQLVNEAG